MKKLFLLLMTLAISNYASAQFILAGDTSAHDIMHKTLNKTIHVNGPPGAFTYYNETNFNLDLNNDGSDDIRFTVSATGGHGGESSACSITTLNNNLIRVTSLPFLNDSNSYVDPLDYHDTISTGNLWYSSSDKITIASSWDDYFTGQSGHWGIWNSLPYKYIGLSVKIGERFYYGWVRMQVHASHDADIYLTDCAIREAYYPLPDSNAQWNMHLSLMGFPGPAHEESYSIVISGDTLIKSLTYHKLTVPYVQSSGKSTKTIVSGGYKGAFRQDTLNRKVFIIPPADTAEQLLYDFTMHSGDTVRGYIESNLNPKDVVVNVDSVLVGNNYRKRWEINPGYHIYFIESIGSTYGLIERSPGQVVDWADISLTCFSENGITVYPDASTNCDLINSVDPVKLNNDQITIYPNPSNGSFRVDFNQSMNISKIQVTDLPGNIILKRPADNQKYTVIENLKSGVYILTVVDKNNRSMSYKIINCP